MRRTVLAPKVLAFVLLFFLPCAASLAQTGARGLGVKQTPPAAARYYALVVGNDDYQSLPRLKTAAADAREVERVLRETYGFQTKLLLNATRSQIVAALYAYRRELSADANLLIYYAGHGYSDKETEKTYWLPVDATGDDNSNWIIADDITSDIKAIPARHVLVVADSCYSGTLSRGLNVSPPPSAEREQFIQKMSAGRSRTLMASGGDEPVADGGGSGHSVFAAALLRGLQQMEKTQFTAGELFSGYVVESVAGRAEQTPVYDPLRNSGHESGDFVFVRIKTPDGKTVEVTVETKTTKVDPEAIELSYWETIKDSKNPEDFKAYLEQYPNGRFASLARIRASGATNGASVPATGRMLRFDFNSAKGVLATDSALGDGVVVTGGSLQIESTAGSNIVMPAGLNKVAFFNGPPLINTAAPAGLTCAELTFTGGDVSAVSVTRPGVTNNSSTPAWQMQAFDVNGSRVGETVGEGDIVNGNYLFPSVPQDFTINAAGIHKIQLCSKNHLSTFSAVPIARISHAPAAVSLTGTWWPSDGPPIRFVQQGNRVTGTYRGGRGHESMTGTISGTFDGKSFDGTFENHEGSVSGRGTVTLTLNGDRLEGVWVATSTPGVSGEWILRRKADENTNPPTPAPPSASGRWTGSWTNSKGDSGRSSINISEQGAGAFTGDEGGWVIVNGRRDGNVLTWEYRGQDNDCVDYAVRFEISADGSTANGTYTANDRCKKQTYTGKYLNYHR
jgi:hypothetical protein